MSQPSGTDTVPATPPLEASTGEYVPPPDLSRVQAWRDEGPE